MRERERGVRGEVHAMFNVSILASITDINAGNGTN